MEEMEAFNIATLVGLAVALTEEEEEEERVVLAVARLAVEEVMELEEPGLGDESSWVRITVDINEYHYLGDPCFKMHFRMSRTVLERLVVTVHNHLVETGRLQKERTPTADLLLMCLWILATPDSFRSVALRFGVRPSTLWHHYSYVIEGLRELAPRFISWPDAEERTVIKNNFQANTGFPGVIGCIDGTHVYLTAPTVNPASYVNRYSSYSINVQAVVDHNLLVRQLHVREAGSMTDQRVFRRSPLCHDLMLRGDNRIREADEYLLGDGGYTLTDFMMIPFANNGHLTPNQMNFNRRLSQGRVRVENAFGRGKGKWRRLKFLHARNPAIVTDHITASFVLHNFTILNGEPPLEDGELQRGIRRNEILFGNEDVEDDPDDPEYEDPVQQDPENIDDRQLFEEAQERGIETRIFIMDHMLPGPGLDDD